MTHHQGGPGRDDEIPDERRASGPGPEAGRRGDPTATDPIPVIPGPSTPQHPAEQSGGPEESAGEHAQPTQAEPTQAEPTQTEPTQAEPTQAEPTQAGERPVTAGGDNGGGRHRSAWRARNWGHLYHTRIRTSTTVLIVMFIVCWVIYGYTSQRYAPPPEPVNAPRQVVRTTEPTFSRSSTTPSSSTSSSPSSSSESSGASSGPSRPGSGGGPVSETGSGQPTTPTNGIVPGFQMPWETTTETTTVPSR
ncbi:hypothetical protein ACPXB3_10745 [Gordonia sp. DT219]|uniref:hypothetical protein n=1 Tax=Gordonia sp. DT219 TaxID=3416658 RepID=UPI003CF3F751